MVRNVSLLVFSLALLIVPSTAFAGNNSTTLFSSATVTASSQYSNEVCGFRKGAKAAVDTTGPGYFTRRDMTANSAGCISYTATAGSTPGDYLISSQEYRGGGLTVIARQILKVVA